MTKIEWADETWNPVTGCTPISEGCQNCYAKRMANRLKGRYGYPDDDPFRVTFHPDRVNEPLGWIKPKRIFVCSMGDFNHSEVEWNWQYKIIEIMFCNSDHTYMVLTKRPQELAERLDNIYFHLGRNYGPEPFPLKNLWLGVTAENQQRADERIPILLQIPAAVRFVSLEPLLGPVNVFNIPDITDPRWPDWVIVGGETGPGARKMEAEWAYSVRDQCISAGIPFFFKKWGSYYAAYFPDRIDGREWKEFPK